MKKNIRSFNSTKNADNNLFQIPKNLRSDYIRDSILMNNPLEYTEKKRRELNKLLK